MVESLIPLAEALEMKFIGIGMECMVDDEAVHKFAETLNRIGKVIGALPPLDFESIPKDEHGCQAYIVEREHTPGEGTRLDVLKADLEYYRTQI